MTRHGEAKTQVGGLRDVCPKLWTLMTSSMDAVKEQIRVGKAGDSLGVRNTVEIKYKEVQLI